MCRSVEEWERRHGLPHAEKPWDPRGTHDWQRQRLGPARVFDANGLEWEDVAWCDARTGEVCVLVRDEDGLVADDGTGHVVTRLERTAAPLLVVFEKRQR